MTNNMCVKKNNNHQLRAHNRDKQQSNNNIHSKVE